LIVTGYFQLARANQASNELISRNSHVNHLFFF
jgi:hypothetical protein